MGGPEVRGFLTHLAVERDVAVATQNQALNALVFLYREVSGRGVGGDRPDRTAHAPAEAADGADPGGGGAGAGAAKTRRTNGGMFWLQGPNQPRSGVWDRRSATRLLVAAPFREEVVLTLFERLTHFPSSLRALASLTLAVSLSGPPAF